MLNDLDRKMRDFAKQYDRWNSTTTTTVQTPKASPDPILNKMALKALKKIRDLDSLSSEEYAKKYGEDADSDPYVIAEKAIETLESVKSCM